MQPKIDMSCSPLAYPRREMPATHSETFADETVRTAQYLIGA